MKFTVDQIAAMVKGIVIGNGATFIEGAAGLSEAGKADVSFFKDPKNSKAKKAVETTSAGAVVVPEGISLPGKTCIQVKNPMAAFSEILKVIAIENEVKRAVGIHPTAVVAPTASIGKGAIVGPLCVVEDFAVVGDNVNLISQVYVGTRVRIGANSVLYPQVVLREDVYVGERCIIHPGAVLGSDGFGFYFSEGKHNKIPQVGNVVVEDDVEIGSCTAIDRATTGKTLIKKGTKIDNLVHIAHNVEVGSLCLLAAQVAVAGSSTLGNGVVFGGQVGVADHATVGDGVQAGGQSGLTGTIPAGSILFGSPAQPIQETIRQTLLVRRLPDLFKDVKILKEKIQGK